MSTCNSTSGRSKSAGLRRLKNDSQLGINAVPGFRSASRNLIILAVACAQVLGPVLLTAADQVALNKVDWVFDFPLITSPDCIFDASLVPGTWRDRPADSTGVMSQVSGESPVTALARTKERALFTLEMDRPSHGRTWTIIGKNRHPETGYSQPWPRWRGRRSRFSSGDRRLAENLERCSLQIDAWRRPCRSAASYC
jgi:hypothetical protein